MTVVLEIKILLPFHQVNSIQKYSIHFPKDMQVLMRVVILNPNQGYSLELQFKS